MPVSLVKVGNSRAIIIPAKVLKNLDIDGNTSLEMSVGDDSTIRIRKSSSPVALVFPKVSVPEITASEKDAFFAELNTFTPEEIETDERLAYILSE